MYASTALILHQVTRFNSPCREVVPIRFSGGRLVVQRITYGYPR